MSHILFISSNQKFADDLQMQIQKYAPEFSFVAEMPDLILIDEDEARYNNLRIRYPNVPMVLFSGDSTMEEDNLNLVVKKPFSLMRLLDILRAANNRLDNSIDGYLTFNGYELRPSKKEIVDIKNNQVIKLTEKEVGILKYLYKMSPQYVTKTDLQQNVWKYSSEVTTHTIETHIYRLRQKVEGNNGHRLIITDNGGYKLQLD